MLKWLVVFSVGWIWPPPDKGQNRILKIIEQIYIMYFKNYLQALNLDVQIQDCAYKKQQKQFAERKALILIHLVDLAGRCNQKVPLQNNT